MKIEIIATIVMAVSFIATFIILMSIVNRLNKQIERLQDRLMARNYGEYVSTKQPQQTAEEPKRKPLSWYDDPSIDDEEEK